MKKNIYIAYTGGTIGMRPTPEGYKPVPGYLVKLMAGIPEFQDSSMPNYVVKEYTPLIDSSNVSPDLWLRIAKDISENYSDYDGFVVLHGTDTMAYTASALSFMLRNLGKPVILTGGQIPLCELRNDSRENLITSMILAADYPIPEVCLFFGDKLMRGNRSVKVDADAFNAFDSPNFPLLGKAGINISVNWELILKTSGIGSGPNVQPLSESRVASLRLFPGISDVVVKNFIAPPIKGLILETYGVGNAPNHDTALLAALETAVAREVVIVNCTQCLKGRVLMGAYATSTALERIGIVSGLDMTTEAALTKMAYLFSRGMDISDIRKGMQTNLRGELSEK